MELAIPLVGLAGVYFIMNNKKNEEGFGSRGTYENRGLPNIDVPDRNYPEGVSSEIPIINETSDLTSELSTVNKYDGRHVYTDKYFNSKLKYKLDISENKNLLKTEGKAGHQTDQDHTLNHVSDSQGLPG